MRPLVALALLALPAAARAVTLTPVSQNRSTLLAATAVDLDAQGNPIMNDSDGDFSFAPDFLPFVVTDFVMASTLLASASGDADQNSAILAQSLTATGSVQGSAISALDGASDVTNTSDCIVMFTIDQATTYTLTGALDAVPGLTTSTRTSVVFQGPSGLIASIQADSLQNNVPVQQSGQAPAGQYTFQVRSIAATASSDGSPGVASAAFDVTLEFGAGAVDAPVATGTRDTPRAWPNPFRTSTRIETALPEGAPIRADVFDVAGRHVRTLSSAGSTHGMIWDGRSTAGGRVPAGTCFVRLGSQRGTSVLKVLAVR